MKKLFFVIWVASFSLSTVNAQDMYIWCPKDLNPSPQSELLSGDKVELNINDHRIISSKAMIKCTFKDISTSLISFLESAYPNTLFEVKSDFTKNPVIGKIYMQINILEYYATFKLGSWYGKTSLSIEIIDNREEKIKEFETKISKESTSLNFIGLATARKNLNTSYVESSEKLLKYISENLQ